MEPTTKTKKSKRIRDLISSRERKDDRKQAYSDFVPPKPELEEEDKRKSNQDRLVDEIVLYSSFFQIHIKGGTLNGIVRRLTHKSTIESDVSVFLFGHRPLLSSELFLEKLFLSWNTDFPQPKEQMLPYEIKEFEEDLKLIRLQIGKIIRLWIKNYPGDFSSEDFVKIVESYIQKTFLSDKDFINSGNEIMELLKKKPEPRFILPHDRPPSIIPTSNHFEEFDPTEVARQIALYTQQLLLEVPDYEFVNQQWNKAPEKCPKLVHLISFSLDLREWVASEICLQDQIKDRVRCIKKFLEISQKSREIKDFNTCYQIWAGLQDPSVWRMKNTWAKVEKEKLYWELYFVIRTELDLGSNFSMYRSQISNDPEKKSAVPESQPLIPSIGIILHDLKKIDTNDPETLNVIDKRPDIVNFYKYKKQYDLVARYIIPAKIFLYNFGKVDLIWNYFAQGLMYYNSTQRATLSRQLEPKDRDLPDKSVMAVVPMPADQKLDAQQPPPKLPNILNPRSPLPHHNGTTSKGHGGHRNSSSNNTSSVITTHSNVIGKTVLPNLSDLSFTESGGIDSKIRNRQKQRDLFPEIGNQGGLVLHSRNFQVCLKGGKMEKIISNLVGEFGCDYDIHALLYGYRKFIKSTELLEILTAEWKSAEISAKSPEISAKSPEISASGEIGGKMGTKDGGKVKEGFVLVLPEEMVDETDFHSTHKRICQFIHFWITYHFYDFSEDVEALKKLKSFLQETVFNELNPALTMHGQAISKQLTANVQKIKEENRLELVPNEDKALVDWNDFELEELAQHLTIYEQQLFFAIEPREFMDTVWKKNPEKSVNLLKMLNFSECLVSFIEMEILDAKEQERVLLNKFKRFMSLAVHCREISNFYAFRDISFALFGSKVSRLCAVWEKFTKLEPDLVEKFMEIHREFDQQDNYKIYKKLILECSGPCIPYLAVHLTDIEFAASFAEYLVVDTHEKDFINFQRISAQYDVIKEIIKFQKKPKYEFLEFPKLTLFMKQIVESRKKEDPKFGDSGEERVLSRSGKKNNIKQNTHHEIDKDSRDPTTTKGKEPKKVKTPKAAISPRNPSPFTEPGEILEYDILEISWGNLPLEIKKKIEKLKIPISDIKENISIFWNSCEFLYPELFPSRCLTKRIPYGSQELIANAEKELIPITKASTKKIYKKITFTGKGGFARVFSAKDLSNKKEEMVAIKKLSSLTERDQQNNLCEIGFLKACQTHPNVVQYIKTWSVPEDNEIWIITEFMHGGTLSEAAKLHAFIDRHVAYVAREVLQALKFLHGINYVHRDLKSQNVMMSINGSIKLIDFGLCADFSTGPRNTMVGSPFWLPPEMIKKEPHCFPADIWSLGVCLLELFLAAPPHASSGLKCMFLVATKGLLDQVPKTVTPETNSFLTRCLEVDPTKRASATELLEDPWIKRPGLNVGISDVLKDIFLNHTFNDLGFN